MNNLKYFIQELVLPDKDKLKISEVVAISKLQERVLKYWEQEFNFFDSKRQGQLYSKKELLIILIIKELLVIQRQNKENVKKKILESMDLIENKFTNANKLDTKKKENVNELPCNPKIYSELQNIRAGLFDILKILEK